MSSSLSVSSAAASLSSGVAGLLRVGLRELLARVDNAGGSAAEIEMTGGATLGDGGPITEGRLFRVLDLLTLRRTGLASTVFAELGPEFISPALSSASGRLPERPAPGVDRCLS